MGTIQTIGVAVVSVALAIGSPTAAGDFPSSEFARCIAEGRQCVQHSRIADGERIQEQTRAVPPRIDADLTVEQRRPRLIVEYRGEALHAGSPLVRELRSFRASGMAIVEVRDRVPVEAAIAALRADPRVFSVERDRRVTIFETVPEDPLWIEQWGLRKISAPAAWDHGTAVDDVIVAVIDTGVEIDHPDLEQSIWTAPDGSRGYNCITGDADVTDDNGHGTHVAGIIGAEANADGDPANDVGIAGLNWRARLFPMKFLDASGVGNVSDAIACFERIGELIDAGANIRVTNNSWGGIEQTFALRRSMARLARRGVVHVVAAGNSGRDIDLEPVFPAAYRMPGLITVGSSGISDVPSPFTNHGLANVDLAAPGEYVMSTVPDGGYAYASGTSASAPYVAGVVASMVQSRPDWSARQIRDLLLDTESTSPNTLNSTSSGRLDFERVRVAATLAGPEPPPLNHTPRFSAGWYWNQYLDTGERLQINIAAYDSDPGDEVAIVGRRPAVADLDTPAPLAWMIGQHFPQPVPGGPITLDAPRVERAVSIPYVVSASDGRGGSARRVVYATYLASDVPESGEAQLPAVELRITPPSGGPGSTFELTAAIDNPDGGPVAWGYECHGRFGGFSDFIPGAERYTRTVVADGRFRCRAYLADDDLNLVVSPSVELEIGSDGHRPPTASMTLDRVEGPAPLAVQIDAGASGDVDGAIKAYAFLCGAQGLAEQSVNPTSTCEFRRPGPHSVRLTVIDDDNRTDSLIVPVMVWPWDMPQSEP